MLRLGLIGCGAVARAVHLDLLTRLPGATLVAVAEPDPRLRQEAQRRAPSAVACADYLDVVAMPVVDAVVICLPTALHAAAAGAALRHGKHVYLEKPLATSLADGRDLLAAWRAAGVAGMIGFNYRFNKLYQAARRAVQAGRLGALVGARSVFSSTGQSLPTWRRTRATGGGVLLDLASHHVDLVHFLFTQPVRAVFASLRSQRTEADSAMLELTLADGLRVHSFCSSGSVEEDRFEIYGQAGKLVIDRYMSLDVELTAPTRAFARLKDLQRGLRWLAGSPYLLEKLRAPLGEPSYRTALATFVGAIQANQPARPDFYDGFQSLAVIAAAEESAVTGRVVPVDSGASAW